MAALKIHMAKKNSKRIEHSKDIPVNLGMLHLVRDELKSSISSLERKMESRFRGMDAKFAGIDSKFAEMDSKFAGMDSKFAGIDSKFAALDSKMASMDSRLHQMQLMMEEQNARNRIVMDGLTSLFARQERSEDRIEAAEKLLIQIRAK